MAVSILYTAPHDGQKMKKEKNIIQQGWNLRYLRGCSKADKIR